MTGRRTFLQRIGLVGAVAATGAVPTVALARSVRDKRPPGLVSGLAMRDAASNPHMQFKDTNGSGVLYYKNGALYYRGAYGTITCLGTA